MNTLRDLRLNLGWSRKRLSDESGVPRATVIAAEQGSKIRASSAKAIADALSLALSREIRVTDIEGLNIE